MDTPERMQTLASTKIAYAKKRLSGSEREEPDFVADPGDVDSVLEEWPPTPQKVAKKLVEQYGPPDEATPSRLIWHRNGPWKRMEITRDEIPHKFPTSHTDFISQFIDYTVPAGKADELIEFDGSVLVDRTAGELGARCDMEAMNILTLNLAHEIVTGIRSVEDAREHYADQASAYVLGRDAPYAERLLFDVPGGQTADLDESIIAEPMARQMAEKMKELIGS